MMFTSIEPSPRVAPFILQMIAVPAITGAVAAPVLAIYSAAIRALTIGPQGSPLHAFDVFIVFCAGIAAGFIVGERSHSLISTGRWIWVVSFSVFLLAFLTDLAHPPLHMDLLSDYFYPTGNDEGLTRFLLTFPAFSSCGYSIGLLLAARKTIGAV